ncbi:MAG: hypothetical protein AAF089_06970 [Bacteroidota bacterium]
MSVDTPTAEPLRTALNTTVHDLERGLRQLPLAKAINHLRDWERHLRATDRADLLPIADELAGLDRYLAGTSLDAREIGETLAQLGAQTQGVADTAPDAMRNALHRLGSILQRTGYALAGRTGPSR